MVERSAKYARRSTVAPGAASAPIASSRKRSARTALTRSQFAVLNAVKQSGGGGTQSTLVEATGIDRSSMADLVSRLVKRGWLRRRRAEHDKRANDVQLTAKGAVVFAAAEPAARQTTDLLLAPLSQADRLRFLRALEQIAGRG